MKMFKNTVFPLLCAATLTIGSQAQALTIPGADKAASYLAGAVADNITKLAVSGKVVKTQDLCKKGNALNFRNITKVTSASGAKKVVKDSISIRSASGLMAKGSKTLAAFGLLACQGVGDFDKSSFAKNAKNKLSDTSEAALKKTISNGILKAAGGVTSLICTATAAGIGISGAGLSALPAIASACGATIATLQSAIK